MMQVVCKGMKTSEHTIHIDSYPPSVGPDGTSYCSSRARSFSIPDICVSRGQVLFCLLKM